MTSIDRKLASRALSWSSVYTIGYFATISSGVMKSCPRIMVARSYDVADFASMFATSGQPAARYRARLCRLIRSSPAWMRAENGTPCPLMLRKKRDDDVRPAASSRRSMLNIACLSFLSARYAQACDCLLNETSISET